MIIENRSHRKRMLRSGSLFGFIIFLCAANAVAGTATLSWDRPTTRTDGTALSDLAGFKIYYGTASRTYTIPISVSNVNSYTFNNLADGVQYFFNVTAYERPSDRRNSSRTPEARSKMRCEHLWELR